MRVAEPRPQEAVAVLLGLDGRMASDTGRNHERELYANYFQIGYNAVEFLLDFGRQFEDTEQKLYQRIIMNPVHARILLRLLEESIRQYEAKYGPIPEDQDL